MSSFTVSLTPKRNTKEKIGMESREPTEVFMAPFSAKSIVQFEDIPVSKTAKRLLRIRNPTDEPIQVKISKSINPDHKVSVQWTEQTIDANSTVEMELIWIPATTIACVETMQLIDNRNFRKDVTIILKSKSNKPVKSVRRYPTLSNTVANMKSTQRVRSPVAAIKCGKSVSQVQRSRQHSTEQAACTSSSYNLAKWDNCMPTKQRLPTKKSINVAAVAFPLTERNASPTKKIESIFNLSPDAASDGASKENISPLTPSGINSILDKMKFTPATETKPYPSSALENLANLPTPIAEPLDALRPQTAYRDIRPRRLTAADFIERDFEENESAIGPRDSVVGDIATPTIVINKTFEVRGTEVSCSPNTDVINESFGNVVENNTNTPALNNTTTISVAPVTRQLEMIREEEILIKENETVVLEKTFAIKAEDKAENLKRDIKLIGTPLRKLSESMKDLSLKSPNSKNVIQQGSMPNLNEMETIRSFEQNRYFRKSPMHTIQEDQNRIVPVIIEPKAKSETDSPPVHPGNLTGVDLAFDQNEIRAQSSRFDLTELDKICRDMTAPEERYIYKRRSSDLSIPNSISNESIASTATSHKLSVRSDFIQVSPPKRHCTDASFAQLRAATTPRNASAAASKRVFDQNKTKKLRLSSTLSLAKKPITPRKSICETRRVKLYDSDSYMQQYLNPDPFAATTTYDPFLAPTAMPVYVNIEKHHMVFKKWLNALVSIPEGLDADCSTKVDVAKLFNEVRNKELTLAPTKEEQSMNYLTKSRLESLRRAAIQLYMSDEMKQPCAKVIVYISRKAISIRQDRNLHLDIVMQRTILELLLCFNPLWLRLGLEVVYGEKIHLHSNSDIVGLSTFILNRLFRDKLKEVKHSKAYTLSDDYADYVKRYTLEKVLLLLLFLDKAKCHRIIKHNPCLFVKTSPYKETKDILCRFSSELLANVGDIKRELKRLGFVLEHKQTYMDEFDYAFNNLAVDLRDGVRLTRVMEIILLQDNLTKQLRVPAISRLQRIYNVNLALTALQKADFTLNGDIVAADIVDGHLEKTFSLLWQIIYKFRSPKFHAAARQLQQWWRRRWLSIVIRRRIQQKEFQRRQRAAICIQSCFRGYMTRKYIQVFKEERNQAAVVLQKYVRRYLAQKQVVRIIEAIVTIQRRFRTTQESILCRQQYLRLRECTIYLQRSLRRHILSQKLLEVAKTIREQQEADRNAAATRIQRRWRDYCAMRIARLEFQHIRGTVLNVQRRYRAKLQMRQQMCKYQRQRSLIVAIQRRFRAKLLQRSVRKQYINDRELIIKLQQRWRAIQLGRSVRFMYNEQRDKIIYIQRRMRAHLAMKRTRADYHLQRNAAVKLQRWYRSILQMRKDQKSYTEMRHSCIVIQRRWRARIVGKEQRQNIQKIRSGIINIQRKWRATLRMRAERMEYLLLRRSVINIQQRYRAQKEMLKIRNQYLLIRSLVVCMQRKFRAHLEMLRIRNDYLILRRTVVHLQQRFRGHKLMLEERARFISWRSSVIQFQARVRGHLARQRFQALLTPEMMDQLRRKKAIKVIQRYWRGYCVRKRLQDVKIKKIRKNIVALKARSGMMSSIRKTVQDAVRFLHGRFKASEMIAVLRQLDRLSRNVPHLMSEQADYFATFCYGIMAQAIRSEVDKQHIEYCSRILLNLSRYNSTTTNTFQRAGWTTIAQILLRWCDKDCDIFNTLCTLIWVLAHCEDKRMIIRGFMTTPEAIFMLRETRKLVARKEKMRQNVRKPICPSPRSTSATTNLFSGRTLPSLAPDYGVIHSKPYIFISSEFAFETVLHILRIELC